MLCVIQTGQKGQFLPQKACYPSIKQEAKDVYREMARISKRDNVSMIVGAGFICHPRVLVHVHVVVGPCMYDNT